MKHYYAESRRNEHPTYNKGGLTGLVTSCVGTAFQITLLKEAKRYGKSKVTELEVALEEAMDLS